MFDGVRFRKDVIAPRRSDALGHRTFGWLSAADRKLENFSLDEATPSGLQGALASLACHAAGQNGRAIDRQQRMALRRLRRRGAGAGVCSHSTASGLLPQDTRRAFAPRLPPPEKQVEVLRGAERSEAGRSIGSIKGSTPGVRLSTRSGAPRSRASD